MANWNFLGLAITVVLKSMILSGKYYSYDCSRHTRHDSIMADQCAGQWFLYICGIDDVSDIEVVLQGYGVLYQLVFTAWHEGLITD